MALRDIFSSGKSLIVAASFFVTALAMALLVWVFGTVFSLSTLALGGVVVLLGALLVFTTIMNVVGLSDRTQALGLPDGSVRAIIALALVGLFAILASSALEQPKERSIPNLTEAEVALFRRNNPDVRELVQVPQSPQSDGVQRFRLTYSASPYTDDFPKQILTLVGTLMTAVIAFYFGGKTALAHEAAGAAGVSRAAPELSGVADGTRPPVTGPLSLALKGTHLNGIRAARLTRGSTEVEASAVLSNPTEALCSFPAHPAFNEPGRWTVTVVDDLGRVATMANALEIAASRPQQPAAPKPQEVTPATAAEGASEFTIKGSGLQGVTRAEAVPAAGGQPVQATELKAAAEQVAFKLALTKGEWSLRVMAGTAAPVAVPGRITIT